MPTYDASRYNPPAPVAHVTLRDSSTGTLLPNVPLLIDTGADITLLPSTAVQRLRAQRRNRSNQCIVCGYDLRATPTRCPERGSEAGVV